MTNIDIKELEQALAPKKRGGKKSAAKKKVNSSSQSDIMYVDSKGNEVEPEDIEEGKTYYMKEVKENGNHTKGRANPKH